MSDYRAINRERVQKLDFQIQSLRAAITMSTSTRINAPFREAFEKMYKQEWSLFRDGALGENMSALSTLYEPRLQDFIASHDRWSAEYMKRKLPHEVDHSPASAELRRAPTPVADAVRQATEEATRPLNVAAAGFSAGVLAVVFVAALVAWKR